jgi:hypothetical protein
VRSQLVALLLLAHCSCVIAVSLGHASPLANCLPSVSGWRVNAAAVVLLTMTPEWLWVPTVEPPRALHPPYHHPCPYASSPKLRPRRPRRLCRPTIQASRHRAFLYNDCTAPQWTRTQTIPNHPRSTRHLLPSLLAPAPTAHMRLVSVTLCFSPAVKQTRARPVGCTRGHSTPWRGEAHLAMSLRAHGDTRGRRIHGVRHGQWLLYLPAPTPWTRLSRGSPMRSSACGCCATCSHPGHAVGCDHQMQYLFLVASHHGILWVI